MNIGAMGNRVTWFTSRTRVYAAPVFRSRSGVTTEKENDRRRCQSFSRERRVTAERISHSAFLVKTHSTARRGSAASRTSRQSVRDES